MGAATGFFALFRAMVAAVLAFDGGWAVAAAQPPGNGNIAIITAANQLVRRLLRNSSVNTGALFARAVRKCKGV